MLMGLGLHTVPLSVRKSSGVDGKEGKGDGRKVKGAPKEE